MGDLKDCDSCKSETYWAKLVEKTLGAFRHVMLKHGTKGYMPVGFSIIFYSATASPEKKWYYDSRNLIDTHNMPDLNEKKLSERINLVNEFLSEGVKRILEGEMDELMSDSEELEGFWYQSPGAKGKA